MSDRIVLKPTAQHPITIEATNKRVQVRIDGEVVADTIAALQLKESTYPVVQYIPLADIAQDRLTRTDTSTYCPFKGEASYHSVSTLSGTTVQDAMWTYEQPYPAVAAIAGHAAFYPDKVEISIV